MANGRASSPIPNIAPPKENSTNSTGTNKNSFPCVLEIIFMIPASTAPVFSTIPKAPPITNKNATIPTADPHLSPLTKPSNT